VTPEDPARAVVTGERPLPDVAEAVALARLGAAAGTGEAEVLMVAIESALASGVTTDDVEEIILQTYLFAGFPAAINAFYAWQGHAVRSGRKRGWIGVEPSDPALSRERGEALCRRVYGDDFEALQVRLARLHPALAEWTLVDGYGKTLSRPGPDAARREVAAVGTLLALGAERQLASHLLGALHVGLPRTTLEAAARAVAGDRGREALVERLLAKVGRPA
jgi:4-carboxymuconolactone decarboxylase